MRTVEQFAKLSEVVGVELLAGFDYAGIFFNYKLTAVVDYGGKAVLELVEHLQCYVAEGLYIGVFGLDSGDASGTFGAAGDTGDTLEITGTKQNSLLHGKVDTFERDLTRSGNIGVKTATDMIISDVDFWSAHNFFEQICADIASILTIPVYE